MFSIMDLSRGDLCILNKKSDADTLHVFADHLLTLHHLLDI